MARSRQEENQPASGHAPGAESLGAPGELLDERVTLVMVEFDREERATAPSREVTPVVAEFEEEPESAAPSLSALALLQRMLGPEEPSEEFSAEEGVEAEVGSPSNVLALTMLFQPDPAPPDGAAAVELSAAEGDVDEEQASDELSFAAAVRVGGAAPVEGVRERAAAEASGGPGGAEGAGSEVASDGTGGGDAPSEGRVGRDGVFATDEMVGKPAEDGFVGTRAAEAVEGGGVPAAEVHEDVAVEEDTIQMAETANEIPALEGSAGDSAAAQREGMAGPVAELPSTGSIAPVDTVEEPFFMDDLAEGFPALPVFTDASAGAGEGVADAPAEASAPVAAGAPEEDTFFAADLEEDTQEVPLPARSVATPPPAPPRSVEETDLFSASDLEEDTQEVPLPSGSAAALVPPVPSKDSDIFFASDLEEETQEVPLPSEVAAAPQPVSPAATEGSGAAVIAELEDTHDRTGPGLPSAGTLDVSFSVLEEEYIPEGAQPSAQDEAMAASADTERVAGAGIEEVERVTLRGVAPEGPTAEDPPIPPLLLEEEAPDVAPVVDPVADEPFSAEVEENTQEVPLPEGTAARLQAEEPPFAPHPLNPAEDQPSSHEADEATVQNTEISEELSAPGEPLGVPPLGLDEDVSGEVAPAENSPVDGPSEVAPMAAAEDGEMGLDLAAPADPSQQEVSFVGDAGKNREEFSALSGEATEETAPSPDPEQTAGPHRSEEAIGRPSTSEEEAGTSPPSGHEQAASPGADSPAEGPALRDDPAWAVPAADGEAGASSHSDGVVEILAEDPGVSEEDPLHRAPPRGLEGELPGEAVSAETSPLEVGKAEMVAAATTPEVSPSVDSPREEALFAPELEEKTQEFPVLSAGLSETSAGTPEPAPEPASQSSEAPAAPGSADNLEDSLPSPDPVDAPQVLEKEEERPKFFELEAEEPPRAADTPGTAPRSGEEDEESQNPDTEEEGPQFSDVGPEESLPATDTPGAAPLSGEEGEESQDPDVEEEEAQFSDVGPEESPLSDQDAESPQFSELEAEEPPHAADASGTAPLSGEEVEESQGPDVEEEGAQFSDVGPEESPLSDQDAESPQFSELEAEEPPRVADTSGPAPLSDEEVEESQDPDTEEEGPPFSSVGLEESPPPTSTPEAAPLSDNAIDESPLVDTGVDTSHDSENKEEVSTFSDDEGDGSSHSDDATEPPRPSIDQPEAILQGAEVVEESPTDQEPTLAPPLTDEEPTLAPPFLQEEPTLVPPLLLDDETAPEASAEAPPEVAPVEVAAGEVLAEQTPSAPDPAEEAPSEQAPSEQAPSEQAPSEQEPSEVAPVEQPPFPRAATLEIPLDLLLSVEPVAAEPGAEAEEPTEQALSGEDREDSVDWAESDEDTQEVPLPVTHTDGASEMEGPAPTLPEADQESVEEEGFFGEDGGLDAGPEPIGAVEASSPAPAPRSSWWVADDLPLDQGEEPPPLPAEPEPAPLVEPDPEELPPPIEPPPERALWEEEAPASEAPRPAPLPAPAVALVWDLEAEAAPPVEEPPQPTWDLPDWELE